MSLPSDALYAPLLDQASRGPDLPSPAEVPAQASTGPPEASQEITLLRCGVATIQVVQRDMPEGMMGEYDQFLPRISVSRALSSRDQLQTIVHELLHHWDDAYGIGLGEKKVRVLEQVLLASVQENGGFWRDVLAEFGPRS